MYVFLVYNNTKIEVIFEIMLVTIFGLLRKFVDFWMTSRIQEYHASINVINRSMMSNSDMYM